MRLHKGYTNIDSLQEKMDRALNEWLAETQQVPCFYRITPLADMYEVTNYKQSRGFGKFFEL